jgi:NhaP-type Na+/H+ or K+/H+ antiporter
MEGLNYLIIITSIGLAALGMAWMPSISQKTRISYSIIYVLLGVLLYSVFHNLLPLPDPISKNEFTVRLTELVVIISIMGTGLKIDQRFSFKKWRVPFRLISVTMILSIAIVTVIGIWVLGLDLPSALLMGAVLAPTDPVLASDVQVGPPHETEQENVKFSLTAEAGMNDGTAFPFTWLAIAIAAAGGASNQLLFHWIWMDLIYRIIAALVCGFLIGRLLAFLLFYLPEKRNFLITRDGFVAISATLLVYGVTELVHGYGFIAVFVTAITLRNYELHHKFHKKLHDFTDQIERILLSIVLILFGGSLVSGILDQLTWPMALFAIIFVLLICPLTGFISLVGTKLHVKEKFGISFFGIKGMGSFFYLAFALKQTNFAFGEQIWSMVAFIVLLSIFVHGLTATPFMEKIGKEFTQEVKYETVENSPVVKS